MKKRILHADDEAIILKLTSHILGQEEYEIYPVHDGQEAVDAARTMLAQGGLDLVLMDMRMPNRDGMSAIQEIRLFSKNIPIIILSGYMTEELKKKAYDFNCAFMLKPYRNQELIDKVRQTLSGASPEPTTSPVQPTYR